MSPQEYFQRHPRLFWGALAGPVLTSVFALAKLRRAASRRQARRYAALAALTAIQAAGLARIRPRPSRT